MVGVSTIKAFWEAREPDQVAADIKALIARADPGGTLPGDAHRLFLRRQRSSLRVAKASAGDAGPRPSDRAPRAGTSKRRSTSPSPGGSASGRGSHAVPDAIKTLPPDRVLCVFGEDEADKTPCLQTTLPGMEIVHTPGGHHFDKDYPRLGQTIFECLRCSRGRRSDGFAYRGVTADVRSIHRSTLVSAPRSCLALDQIAFFAATGTGSGSVVGAPSTATAPGLSTPSVISPSV